MRRLLSSALAVAVGSASATALLTAPAVAVDRPLVIDHGHIDLFELTYDQTSSQLDLQVKDDSELYGTGTQYHDPADVTLAVDAGPSAVEVPDVEEFAFLGEPGDTVYLLPQDQNPDLPWPGWSTERLDASLPAGTQLADGDAVELSVEVSGPGEVHTFMNDVFGAPINHYIDSSDGGPDVIPATHHAHVHTNWAFAELGDYILTVTPTATTTTGTTLTGPAETYHFRIGDGVTPPPPPGPAASTTTLALSQAEQRFGATGTVTATTSVTAAGAAGAGTVAFTAAGQHLGSATLDRQGRASIAVPTGLAPGTWTITSSFTPADPTTQRPSQSSGTTLTVQKGKPTVVAKLPRSRVAPGARAKLRVKVGGPVKGTGRVRVLVDGEKVAKGMLERGKFRVHLPALGPGQHKVQVRYAGNDFLDVGSDVIWIRVGRG